MAQSSFLGYWRRAPASAFNADEPMSSYRARECYDNLMHFTDEYSQVRINWISPDPEVGTDGIEGSEARTRVWSHVYPHTWLGPGRPANVELYVQACGVLSSADLWFRLVPASSRIGDAGAPAVFDESETFAQLGGGTNSFTKIHVNDSSSVRVFEQGWQTPGVVLDSAGDASAPRMCMMRLEIVCLDGADSFQVFVVYLREFA